MRAWDSPRRSGIIFAVQGPEGSAAVSLPVGDDFSLMRGGPTWRILQPVTRVAPGIAPARKLTFLLLLLTLGPPAIMTWRAGTFLPGSVILPFTGDWFVLSRFLLAMPLLILAARFSDRMVGLAMLQFSTSGVVGDEARPQFERIKAQALRARDAPWAELLCALLALAPPFITPLAQAATEIAATQDSYWRFDAAGNITSASLWLGMVSAAIFRYVMLLWLWRFVLWTWMLWRFARLPLALRATHPDHACGLAFLGLAQSRFAILSAAGALVVCGNCINQAVYGGVDILTFRYLIAAYVIISTGVLLGPLLLMSVPLARARRQDMASYDAMGQSLVQAFDRQWKGLGDTARLDSPSPQTMADFSSVHENIRATSVLPVNRWHATRMLLAALLPFVPLLFIAMSVDELMKRIMSVLV